MSPAAAFMMSRPDRHRTGRPGRQRGRTRRVERPAAEDPLPGLHTGTKEIRLHRDVRLGCAYVARPPAS